MGISTLFKKGLFVFLLLVEVNAFASSPYDYFRTKQSGDWEDPNTWESSGDLQTWVSASLVPGGEASDINIVSGHKVTVTSPVNNESTTIYFFSVEQGAELEIQESGALYLDGFEANIYGKVIATGILSCPYNPIEFYDGSYLSLSLLKNPSLLGQINWSSNNVNGETTCEITEVDKADFLNGRVLGAKHFIYNCTTQSYDTYLSVNTTFFGNFTLISTGSRSLSLSSNLTSGTRDIIVKGNFVMKGGELNLANASTVRTTFKLESAFIFEQGIIKETNSNGVSSVLSVLNAVPLISISNGTFGGKIDLQFATDVQLDLGINEFVGSSGRVLLAGTGTVIKTAHPEGINRSGIVGGNFRFTGAQTVPPLGMTVEYNGTSRQNTGTILNGNLSAVKLIVNNAQGLTYNGTGDISNTISNNLQILQGFLDIGSRSYTGTAFGGTGELRTQGTLPTGLTWTGTVNYNGGSQNIVQGQYNNLKLTGTGTKTFAGTINVSNTLTVSGTSVNVNNQPVHYNGANQNVAGLNYHELFIEGSGTKTVTAAATVKKTLTVSNSVLNANGNLTLLADANSNANVAPLTGSADIIGDVNVQVFLSGLPSAGIRGTRSLSTPINDAAVTGDKTFAQLKQHVVLLGKTGSINGFDDVPQVVTSKSFLDFYYEPNPASATAFENITNINTMVPQGKGFFMYFVGNRDNISSKPGKVRTPYLDPEDVTVTYRGPINKKNISVNVGYTNHGESADGRFFAGNPYPSTIDWSKVWGASTNLSPSIIIVKGGRANSTYNASTNQSVNGGSQYLKTGQGFYVQAASASGGVINFKEDHKELESTSPIHLMQTKANREGLIDPQTGTISNRNNQVSTSNLKKMRFKLEKDGLQEESLIVFGDGFSSSYDMYDSMYIPGMEFGLGLSSISEEGVRLCINADDIANSKKDIKLFVNATSDGEAVLKFSEISGLDDYDIFVKDSFTGVNQRISSNENEYRFEVSRSNSLSYGNDRLSVSLIPPSTLSLIEKSFVLNKQADGVQLSWKTTKNDNIETYVIERADSKGGFVEVGRQQNTALNYEFLDRNPLNGSNYYRIKSIYIDGYVEYSKTAYIEFDFSERISIYPNPVDNILNVDFKSVTIGKGTIMIIDNRGRIVRKEIFEDTTSYKIDVYDLIPGIYTLKVEDTKGSQLSVHKLIKK